ncbi:hypothetical protein Lsha_1259, partial [Legionella shakespearei DSM 23087]
ASANARKPSRDRQEAEQLYWHVLYFLLRTFALDPLGVMSGLITTLIPAASRPGYNTYRNLLNKLNLNN